MERISWNQYFMAQSHLLALRSTCTRLTVGATIVRDNRMIAGGYNGSIAGGVHCIDEGCYVIDNHCVRTIHAEMNAILQCAKFGVATTGAEIYVTHFPCLQCCKAIIQAGIKTVYFAQDYKNHPYGIELFEQAGVALQKVETNEMKLELHHQEKKQFLEKIFQELEKDHGKQAEVEKLKREAEQLFS
ncbi:ComE operon protein 2 [Cytobacillus purgationiresistens]|uniref:ComE operon protein 2 n=1 Tax=Cytobacillus purgationiresistens TaxID=863449 RepID=A0ABU0AE56_9BACI|nr:ComE operon protein 2 [Cytobacillus purgationiresistens]MDQ0269522.1 dCMP deaminase [Cytobacillus purgationiresistens]